MNDAIDEKVTEAIARIEHEAKRIEIDTRIAIQEKSKRWASASAGFLLFFVGLLALVGVREVVNIRNEAAELRRTAAEAYTELQTDLEQITDEIESIRAKVIADGDSFTEDLEVLSDDLEERKEQVAGIDRILNIAQQSLRRADEVAEAQERVREELDNIERLQNSFFNVIVMYPGSADEIRPVISGLRARGYTVLPENVLNVSVDRAEVVYYDADEPKQVEDVRQILEAALNDMNDSDDLQAVSARHIVRNAPRDILVKVLLN